jgi:Ca2+:H+ antiporter
MLSRLAAAAGRRALILGAVATIATIAGAALKFSGTGDIVVFIVTAVALASLASVVGEATDHLGARLGPGATGVVQSALGNLPELFISIFALKAGLVVVVQTALIGSILANSLLVLGLAFLVGGVKHGTQKFGTSAVRMTAVLLVLSVASLAIPTLATAPGGPDFGHATFISVVTSVVLLLVFAGSIPLAIRGTIGPSNEMKAKAVRDANDPHEAHWSLKASIIVLALAGVAAALVSDWFVDALTPAMARLRLSEEFVGLVIVAIAGNAVENVVGITAAARNQADLAVSLILNSSLQIALLLVPVLMLLSTVLGGPILTLVAPMLLIAALALAAVLGALIVFDGESTYVEGMALIGLYIIIAASVWYGRPVGG